MPRVWPRWSTRWPPLQNYAGWPALGAEGRYGFYEARGFHRHRACPQGETMAIVRSFMAHHQGMTITAIANTLQDGACATGFMPNR